MLQELLTDSPESVRWPDALRRAVGTRGFAREVQAVLARAREKGLDGPTLQPLGVRAATCRSTSPPGSSSTSTSTSSTARARSTTPT